MEQFRTKLREKLHEIHSPDIFILPDEWRSIVASDKIVKIYYEEKLQRNCQAILHERILSDTTRLLIFEISYLFSHFTRSIEKEARRFHINLKEVQKEVSTELNIKQELEKVVKKVTKLFPTAVTTEETVPEEDEEASSADSHTSLDFGAITKKKKIEAGYALPPVITEEQTKQQQRYKSRLQINRKKHKLSDQPYNRSVLHTQHTLDFIQGFK